MIFFSLHFPASLPLRLKGKKCQAHSLLFTMKIFMSKQLAQWALNIIVQLFGHGRHVQCFGHWVRNIYVQLFGHGRHVQCFGHWVRNT
jgi:hypothetical protein